MRKTSLQKWIGQEMKFWPGFFLEDENGQLEHLDEKWLVEKVQTVSGVLKMFVRSVPSDRYLGVPAYWIWEDVPRDAGQSAINASALGALRHEILISPDGKLRPGRSTRPKDLRPGATWGYLRSDGKAVLRLNKLRNDMKVEAGLRPLIPAGRSGVRRVTKP